MICESHNSGILYLFLRNRLEDTKFKIRTALDSPMVIKWDGFAGRDSLSSKSVLMTGYIIVLYFADKHTSSSCLWVTCCVIGAVRKCRYSFRKFSLSARQL